MTDEAPDPEAVLPDEPVVDSPSVAPSLDTTHPALNYASRDNIVPDGPGTVADFL